MTAQGFIGKEDLIRQKNTSQYCSVGYIKTLININDSYQRLMLVIDCVEAFVCLLDIKQPNPITTAGPEAWLSCNAVSNGVHKMSWQVVFYWWEKQLLFMLLFIEELVCVIGELSRVINCCMRVILHILMLKCDEEAISLVLRLSVVKRWYTLQTKTLKENMKTSWEWMRKRSHIFSWELRCLFRKF